MLNQKITDMLAMWPAWNEFSVVARGKILRDWASLLSSPISADKALSEQSLSKQLLLKQQVSLIDEASGLLAAQMVHYQVKQAQKLIGTTELMPGPTGETNTLSTVGRGIFVIAADCEAPISAIVGFISCALIAGNSVVLALSGQDELADYFYVSLNDIGLTKSVISHVKYSEIKTLINHPSIAGVVFIGDSSKAMTLNQCLANRQGQIATFIVENDFQQLATLSDHHLLFRFISEKTQSINVTAVGGNAALLALGAGDQ